VDVASRFRKGKCSSVLGFQEYSRLNVTASLDTWPPTPFSFPTPIKISHIEDKPLCSSLSICGLVKIVALGNCRRGCSGKLTFLVLLPSIRAAWHPRELSLAFSLASINHGPIWSDNPSHQDGGQGGRQRSRYGSRWWYMWTLLRDAERSLQLHRPADRLQPVGPPNYSQGARSVCLLSSALLIFSTKINRSNKYTIFPSAIDFFIVFRQRGLVTLEPSLSTPQLCRNQTNN
jgi:hypothetical protein